MGKQMYHLDSTDKRVKSLKVGDSITVTLKGKVKSLEGSRTFPAISSEDEPDKMPASVGIEVSSSKIEEASNAFSRMADQDMAETNGD